jgi:mono/diheme cytochrome c family protein
VLLAVVAAHGPSRSTRAVRAAAAARPPLLLSQTGLFEAGRPDAIVAGVRPFAPQYPLWTDGASKRRFVHLPEGAAIDASDTHAWELPVGTKLWKEFAFAGRPVETRLLWRATSDEWVVAAFVWREDGKDAVLAPDEGVPGIVEIAPGRRHSVPGRADCAACHGSPARPLGFGAVQLSTDRDPLAIHGEPLAPGMVTLETLVEEGWLSPDRRDLVETPPRVAARSPRARAALGYLAANCGACHDGRSPISANLPPLGWAELAADADAVAESLVGRRTRWQVPGAAEGASVAVDPAHPQTSALLARMRSRRPSSQMPPLGTAVRDEAALEAISRWIAEDLAATVAASRVATSSPAGH